MDKINAISITINISGKVITECSKKKKIKRNKYLGILEADTIKQAEMKEKKLKFTPGERETKLHSRKPIKGINTL